MGPQCLSGRFGEENNRLSLYRESNHWFPIASSSRTVLGVRETKEHVNASEFVYISYFAHKWYETANYVNCRCDAGAREIVWNERERDMMKSLLRVLHRYILGHQVKEYDLVWACSTRGVQEKRVRHCSRETWRGERDYLLDTDVDGLWY